MKYIISLLLIISITSCSENKESFDSKIYGCYSYGAPELKLEFTINGIGYHYYILKDNSKVKEVFTWKATKDSLFINFGSNEMYSPKAPVFYGFQKVKVGYVDGDCDNLIPLNKVNKSNGPVGFSLNMPVFGDGISYPICIVRDNENCSFDFKENNFSGDILF